MNARQLQQLKEYYQQAQRTELEYWRCAYNSSSDFAKWLGARGVTIGVERTLEILGLLGEVKV